MNIPKLIQRTVLLAAFLFALNPVAIAESCTGAHNGCGYSVSYVDVLDQTFVTTGCDGEYETEIFDGDISEGLCDAFEGVYPE